jgi:hypothetical protein
MRTAAKANALELEFLSNQVHQINSGNDQIAPQHPGRLGCHAKMFCHQIENFPGEKGDLPFVVIGIIEKAIAAQTAAGDTFDPLGFEERGIVRHPAVVSKIVVPGRGEDLLNDHALKKNPAAEKHNRQGQRVSQR